MPTLTPGDGAAQAASDTADTTSTPPPTGTRPPTGAAVARRRTIRAPRAAARIRRRATTTARAAAASSTAMHIVAAAAADPVCHTYVPLFRSPFRTLLTLVIDRVILGTAATPTLSATGSCAGLGLDRPRTTTTARAAQSTSTHAPDDRWIGLEGLSIASECLPRSGVLLATRL